MQLFDNNRHNQKWISLNFENIQAFENDFDIGSDFEKYGSSMQIFGKRLVLGLPIPPN